MAEHARSHEEKIEEEMQRIDRDSVDVGTGLGGGLAPVLPTDLDGQHPDSDWLATSRETAQLPNWIAAEEVEPGRERLEPQRGRLQLSHDTHLVSVFGEDLGRIEEVYGYAPSNDPAWAAVKEGDRKVMVPVMSGQMEDDGLHVPYPKNLIESAPELPEGFSIDEEMALYRHYNERRILPAADGYTQDSDRTLRPFNIAA